MSNEMVPDFPTTKARVDAMLTDLEGKATAMLAEATDIQITDAVSKVKAGEIRVALGDAEKRIEAGLKNSFAPWKQAEKTLRALFIPATDKIAQGLTIIKAKIIKQVEKEENAAREAARAENARMEKLHERKVDRAEEAGRAAPPPPVKIEVAKTAPIGGATVRRVWDFKVVNINAVPADLLEVKRGDVLRELSRMEGVGSIDALASEEHPSKVLPGLVAFKRVSA